MQRIHISVPTGFLALLATVALVSCALGSYDAYDKQKVIISLRP